MADAIRLDDVADHVRLGKDHLVRAFRAAFGIPPYEFLTHARVHRARDLLRDGATAAAAATAVGFCDQSQLHRHFVRPAQARLMDLGLKGKAVLVTGGSRGIGRAAALAFAREGARVAVTYASRRELAEKVVAELVAAGAPDAAALSMSLADPESIRTAVGGVVERFGAVDVLVNNAVSWGEGDPSEARLFEDRPPASWRPMLEANIEGHYHAIQRALPSMRARSWGRIVNVSSTVAADGLPGSGPYGAAKAALHGLTRTLARELGPVGILVNVVMPGLTLTETNIERIPKADLEPIAATTPLRRLLRPEKVAATIVFLGSAANTAITGELLRASGGAR